MRILAHGPALERYHHGVRHLLILPIGFALLLAGACGSQEPSPSSPPAGPGTPDAISGRERIGWDQQAEDAAQLAGFSFVVYVDGVRNELTAVSCAPGSGSQIFACSGKGPDLAPGSRTLELAAFTADGEGPRSSPLTVLVNRLTSGTPPIEWPSGTQTTADGQSFRIEKLLQGLDDPVDAAFVPDGRLFIAERGGRVRIVDQRQLQAPDALTTASENDAGPDRLLSIAVDPAFERTHLVFVIHATRTASGDVFRVARYREVRGTLAERAVLIEVEGPAIADAAAVLRIGPDARMYLAVGAAGFPGTLLRLNLDGTMPRDQSGTRPALAQGLQSPQGLGADPRSGIVWIADEQDGEAHLSGVALEGKPLRAVVRARHLLPGGAGSLAFYSGDLLPAFKNTLLLASAFGRHIERIRFSAEEPDRIAASDTLLQDAVGPIQVVAVGPDGAVYFCTAEALGRITGE
jgi:glucose/arabinose dehydrogenase